MTARTTQFSYDDVERLLELAHAAPAADDLPGRLTDGLGRIAEIVPADGAAALVFAPGAADPKASVGTGALESGIRAGRARAALRAALDASDDETAVMTLADEAGRELLDALAVRQAIGLALPLSCGGRLELVVARRDAAPAFTDGDTDRLRLLGPYLADLIGAPISGRTAAIALGASTATTGAVTIAEDGAVIDGDEEGMSLLRLATGQSEPRVPAAVIESLRAVTRRPEPTSAVFSFPGGVVILERSDAGGPPFAVSVRLYSAGSAELFEALAERIHLTTREREVARLTLAGLSNRAIARRLGLSHNTVAYHLKHLFAKAGTGSRSQLAALLLTGSRTAPFNPGQP